MVSSALPNEVFDRVLTLAYKRDRPQLLHQLRNEMLASGFVEQSDVEWAYQRVMTYLEDGAAASCYWLMKPHFQSQQPAILFIMNKIVGGYRADKQLAKDSGAKWLYADDTGDIAAFLMWVTTEKPLIKV
jgi:hypothetical protein